MRLSSPAGPGVVQWDHHQRHLGLLWANPRADVQGNPGTHGLSHRLLGSTSEEQSGPKSQVGPQLWLFLFSRMIQPLLHCRIEVWQPRDASDKQHERAHAVKCNCYLSESPLQNMSRVPFRGNRVHFYALNCRFIPIGHILTLQISLATEFVGSAITIAFSPQRTWKHMFSNCWRVYSPAEQTVLSAQPCLIRSVLIALSSFYSPALKKTWKADFIFQNEFQHTKIGLSYFNTVVIDGKVNIQLFCT